MEPHRIDDRNPFDPPSNERLTPLRPDLEALSTSAKKTMKKLTGRMEAIRAAGEILTKVSRNPTRVVLQGLGALGGVAVLTGATGGAGTFLGLALGASAATDAYLYFTEHPAESMRELIVGAREGVEMIQELNQTNIMASDRIKENLNDVRDRLEGLEAMMNEIDSLADGASEELQEAKEHLHAQYNGLREQHRHAMVVLEQAKYSLMTGMSYQAFAEGQIAVLNRVVEEVQSGDRAADESTFSDIVDLTNAITETFERSDASLGGALTSLTQGLSEVGALGEMQMVLARDIGTFIAHAQRDLNEIKGIAKGHQEIERLQEINDSLLAENTALRQRLEAQAEIEQDVIKELREAENQRSYGVGALAFGGAVGVAASFMTGGLGSVAAAAVGVEAYEQAHRRGIGLQTITALFWDIVPTEEPGEYHTEHLTFRFNPRSANTISYVMGRPSVEEGELQIRLGGEKIMTCKIDFSRKSPLSRRDMKDLDRLLRSFLVVHPEYVYEVLKLLMELEQIEIERGIKGEKIRGLIQKNYFILLTQLCIKIMKNNPEVIESAVAIDQIKRSETHLVKRSRSKIDVRFDEKSKGWKRYVKQSPSHSLGVIDITLRNTQISFRFNLLNAPNKISQEDQERMVEMFRVMLERDPNLAPDIMDTILELKELEIDRGDGYGIDKGGMINMDLFETLIDEVCFNLYP